MSLPTFIDLTVEEQASYFSASRLRTPLIMFIDYTLLNSPGVYIYIFKYRLFKTMRGILEVKT